jgi:putative CocE/NonD family hydrolase
MEVTGPVTLELWEKSSVADTDFTAKLVDVEPDGFARNLTEGILRARFRDSQETPTLLTSGQAYKLEIDLWATSNVFKKGHVIRLEVSSSNFPRFDLNLNLGTMGYAGQETAGIAATNAVLHDAQHPSVLILPVVAK